MDEAELKEIGSWLRQQPHQTQVWISTRAAMRIAPLIGSEQNLQKFESLALTTFRALLVAVAASKCTSKEVDSLFYNAQSALSPPKLTNDADEGAKRAMEAAIGAARCAAHNHHPAAAGSAIEVSSESVKLGGETAQKCLRDDMTSNEISERPLWLGHSLPKHILDGLEMFDKKLPKGHRVWGVWRRWYDAVFLGSAEFDSVSLELAKNLGGKDWNSGAVHVANKFSQALENRIIKSTPLAERVSFEFETNRFLATPEEIQKPDLLSATLSQVEDTLTDVLATPSNGLNETSQESKVIRRALTKYGNNPQQIEMGFTSTHASLTRKIISEELPPSDENLALQRALEEGAQGIRATDPDIAENRRILDEQKFAELSEAQKSTLADAAPMLDAISEGVMQEDFAEDIAFVLSEDMRAPPYIGGVDRNPVLAGYDEKRRIFSRVAKIAVLMRKTPEIILKIDASAGFKAAGILMAIAGLVQLAISLL